MLSSLNYGRVLLASVLGACAMTAGAQSFRVQCPTSTITHPVAANNNAEPAYPSTNGVNGAIKCQQIAGGDGYATMADGTQTYLFSFGPLSGIADITRGKPGTQFPSVFNTPFAVSTSNYMVPGDPATSVDTAATTSGGFVQALTPAQLSSIAGFYNGAIGLDYNVANTFSIYDVSESGNTVTVVLNAQSPFAVGDQIVIGQGAGTDLAGYTGNFTITAVNITNPFFPNNYAFQYTDPTTGLAEVTESPDGTASSLPSIDGHVDARQIMDVGVMNGNIPAPMMAIDEDDEFFLTLTNVGMIMRPDLFEQHTVHDASVAINIAASFTYYYLAPDAGTYFWHCHITPPEHLQMGMVGQMYVRPRQNRVAVGTSLYTARATQDLDLRMACVSANDILCSHPLPAVNTAVNRAATGNYAYNDGDGSTYFDVEYPLQMHGFDPNFHFVGMTFNPEGFADMKDKYFLLNGRSYPDTVNPDPLQTQSADGVYHFSQPLPTIIKIAPGQRALLRISDLVVS